LITVGGRLKDPLTRTGHNGGMNASIPEPDLPLQQVLTPQDVRQYVEDLIGYATNPGQLWLLFLDTDRRPLQALMPVEHIPALPDEYVIDTTLRMLVDVAAKDAFGWIVFVLERWGSAGITGSDRSWASMLAERSVEFGLQVAGVVLCTPQSVRHLPMTTLH
jgi:hypothetical protein